MVARANPVCAQFGLMRSGPLDDQPSSAGRQVPGEDRKALHIESGLVVAIASVEVWAPP
jgi:hypothetical protein